MATNDGGVCSEQWRFEIGERSLATHRVFQEALTTLSSDHVMSTKSQTVLNLVNLIGGILQYEIRQGLTFFQPQIDLDVYGALGEEALSLVQLFAERRANRQPMSVGSSKRIALEGISLT